MPVAVETITVQARRRDGWISNGQPHFTLETVDLDIQLPAVPPISDPAEQAEYDTLLRKAGPGWAARIESSLFELRDNPAAMPRWAAGDQVPSTIRSSYHFDTDGNMCEPGRDSAYLAAGWWLPAQWHCDNLLTGLARHRVQQRNIMQTSAARQNTRLEHLANNLTAFQPTIRERQLLAWIRQELALDSYGQDAS